MLGDLMTKESEVDALSSNKRELETELRLTKELAETRAEQLNAVRTRLENELKQHKERADQEVRVSVMVMSVFYLNTRYATMCSSTWRTPGSPRRRSRSRS